MTAAVLALLGNIWPYLLAGAGVVAAYFGVKAKGASDQKAATAVQVAKQDQQAQTVARKVDNEVDRKTDDAVVDELSRGWVRNKQ